MSAAKPGSVRELLPVAAEWLASQGIEEARVDAEHLLAHVLSIERLGLYTDHDRPVDEDERARFRALMKRRAAREPVAYLVGSRGFWGLLFEVGPGVLVPRPETEHLVEVGLEALKAAGVAAPRVADVGTGSGCIALSLLSDAPAARAVLIDRSSAALRIAARNAVKLGLQARAHLVRGDLLACAGERSLDLVLSNPPYVLRDETRLLAPEVLRHEPHEALFDQDGLPLTATLARQAARALRPGGTLAVETGVGSADLVARHLESAGFTGVRRVKDLGGIERVIVGRLPG